MIRRTRSYRGLSARAAIGYLERLGGERVADRRVEGAVWEATLSEEKVSVGASLELTEVTVVFESEADGELEDLIEAFSQKAIRAGG